MKLFTEIKTAIEGVFDKVASHVHEAITFTEDEIKVGVLAFIKGAEDPSVLTLHDAFAAGAAFATGRAKSVVSAATATEAEDVEGPMEPEPEHESEPAPEQEPEKTEEVPTGAPASPPPAAPGGSTNARF